MNGEWKPADNVVRNSPEWLWLKEYPYAYSDSLDTWFYIKTLGDTLYCYDNKDNAWGDFNQNLTALSSDSSDSYQSKNSTQDVSDPNVELSVPQQIEEARDSGASTLSLKGEGLSDLSQLSELSNLTILNLDDNYISDLTPLSNLTNLTTLYLSNNNITNLKPLQSLSKLETLTLVGNKISNLEDLYYFDSLVYVESFGYLKNLRNLYLDNNSITDTSPLKPYFTLQNPWGGNLEVLSLKNNQVRRGLLPYERFGHTVNGNLVGKSSLTKLDIEGNPYSSTNELYRTHTKASITFPDGYTETPFMYLSQQEQNLYWSGKTDNDWNYGSWDQQYPDWP